MIGLGLMTVGRFRNRVKARAIRIGLGIGTEIRLWLAIGVV